MNSNPKATSRAKAKKNWSRIDRWVNASQNVVVTSGSPRGLEFGPLYRIKRGQLAHGADTTGNSWKLHTRPFGSPASPGTSGDEFAAPRREFPVGQQQSRQNRRFTRQDEVVIA